MVNLKLGAQMHDATREFHLGLSVDNLFDMPEPDYLSTLKGLNYRDVDRDIIFRIRLPFGHSL